MILQLDKNTIHKDKLYKKISQIDEIAKRLTRLSGDLGMQNCFSEEDARELASIGGELIALSAEVRAIDIIK